MRALWALRAGETCVHIVWGSPWRQALRLGVGGLGVVSGSLGWFSLLGLGVVGKGLLAVVWVASAWMLLRAACVVRRTQLVCTTERVLFVQARGCFDRTVDQATWGDVLDIAYRPDGVWRVFGLARVRVRFHGARREWVFVGVRHGRDVCRLLRDIQVMPSAAKTSGTFSRQHIA